MEIEGYQKVIDRASAEIEKCERKIQAAIKREWDVKNAGAVGLVDSIAENK